MNTNGISAGKPILVLRFSSLGDITLTEPATRALKKRFPDSEIHYLTKSHYPPIVECFEAVDRVIPYRRDSGLAGLIKCALSLRKQSYGRVVDLHGSIRSRIVSVLIPAAHRTRIRKMSLRRFLLVKFKIGKGSIWPTAIERYLACIPGHVDERQPMRPVIRLPREAIDAAEALIRGEESTPQETEPDTRAYLTIAPGARWPTKMWPWERYAELGSILHKETRYPQLILGSENDRVLCHRIAQGIGEGARNLAGRTSLIEAAAVLARSRLLITNDSGLLHLAAAVNTPVLAVFGPTSRELGFYPQHAHSAVIEVPLPCRPCTSKGSTSCPLGTHECMLSIPTETVVQKALQLLGERRLATA